MRASQQEKFENFDPNKSDSDDADFQDGPPSPRPRSSRRKKKSAPARRKTQKRSRRTYDTSDDGIVDDEDEVSEESYESASAVESDEEPEVNASGRPARHAAKKNIKYEESADDDIEEEELILESTEKSSGDKRKQRNTLVVKLKLPKKYFRNTRARSTRAASKSAQSESRVATRRSARLSEDRDEPLQELAFAGRTTSTGGSHSPQRRIGARPAQGRKAPMKRPSTIMEASQEASGHSAQSPDPLQPHDEVQVSQAVSVTDEIRYEGQQAGDGGAEDAVIQESDHAQQSEDDEDEGPVTRTRGRTNVGQNSPQPSKKSAKKSGKAAQPANRAKKAQPAQKAPAAAKRKRAGPSRPKISQRELQGLAGVTWKQAQPSQKRTADESSDFDPDDDHHNDSDSDRPSKRHRSSGDESTGRGKSRRRLKSSRRNSESEEELDPVEIADEAAELHAEKRSRPRRACAERANEGLKEAYKMDEEMMEDTNQTENQPKSSNKKKKESKYPPLVSLSGPFGGRGNLQPLLGQTEYDIHLGQFENSDDDSSDDEGANQSGQRNPPGGESASKTAPSTVLQQMGHESDRTPRGGGGPANLGRIGGTSKADVNPIGVDEEVNFESVGGLDDHINQLKEMVTLPLLYPEIFDRFKVTPPRGVLFHGPPGTGKTLLARALSNALSANGKKVTFYMRKGADALSKWIGEAERQLRMLFEDARRNQPSIIFFDEIDGLAPVRSSRSEQSLASIVATLLALMDGMDDRGQVVIIGATNRPDNVDPALRRPGRFDREFYFPLPDREARRSILGIHTKNWNPPLEDGFKDQLAEMTKGYGGADLRALCTEAAVNAIQGTFPQVYKSNKKLALDVNDIKVSAKDFMISVNKIVPSSQRSASFGAVPLKKTTAPLLTPPLEEISRIIADMIPPKKKLTALEEAQYDDRENFGFERENIKRDFEQVRVFRPRLLVRGPEGMGQQEIGAALLHRFDNMHVQSFDLPNLLGDKDKSAEATLVQLFKEVRTHKPSVIYIPQVDVWYDTVGENVISIFTSLLRTMPANEPVLVLGTMEQRAEDQPPNPDMLKSIFGYSKKNQYELKRPTEQTRKEYFQGMIDYIRMPPKAFPEVNRKKRKFEDLQEVPKAVEEPKRPSKEEIKALRKRDRYTVQVLKLKIQPILDQLAKKYRRFNNPIITENNYEYLWHEHDPSIVTSDLPVDQRPANVKRLYEIGTDADGVRGLVETATGKFYYNLSFEMIEARLANGYYKRPIDFLEDVKRVAKDCRTQERHDSMVRSDEILTNVEVDVAQIEDQFPELVVACEDVYRREQVRLKLLQERLAKEGREAHAVPANVLQPILEDGETAYERTEPITLEDPQSPTPRQRPVSEWRPDTTRRLSTEPEVADSLESAKRPGGIAGVSAEDNSVPKETEEQDSQHRDKRQKTDDGVEAGAPNTQTVNRSQRAGHTQMAPNTQPGDYRNSASTTTSGLKTSERSSAQFANTQSTVNGVAAGQHPDFASGPAQSGGSQIPDTQEPFASSQLSNSQQTQSSQAHVHGGAFMPPARQEAKIGSLLNSSSDHEHDEQQQPQLILDEAHLVRFHEELVRRSSGLSVEQLEQVNAAMMAALWQHRGEWNRVRVTNNVLDVFNDTISDIEAVQKVWPPSQGKDDKE